MNLQSCNSCFRPRHPAVVTDSFERCAFHQQPTTLQLHPSFTTLPQLTDLSPPQGSPSNEHPHSPLSLPSPFSRSPDQSALQSPYSESPLPWFLRPSHTPHCRSPGTPPSPNSFYSTFTSSPSPYTDDIDREFRERRRMYRCITSVDGQQGPVSAIAESGKLLYSGSTDILVSKKPLFFEFTRFGYGYGAVKALLVTDDKVYSAHEDNKIRVWHRHRGRRQLRPKLIATLPTFRDYLSNFIPSKNYRQILRHRKRLWIDHVDTITALALGQNGLLYSSSWDRSVKVWSLSNSRCIESIDAHDDAVNAMVTGCDGLLYTGSADRRVKVWTKLPPREKHQLVTTLEGHESAVNALALSSDGQILYSGGSDRSVRVWEREDSAIFMFHSVSLPGHRQAILCLAVAGNILCSGSADKTIRVWKRLGGVHSSLAVLEGHKGPVKCLSAALDTRAGCLIYSGSMDCSLKVWKVVIEEEEVMSADREGVASTGDPSPCHVTNGCSKSLIRV